MRSSSLLTLNKKLIKNKKPTKPKKKRLLRQVNTMSKHLRLRRMKRRQRKAKTCWTWPFFLAEDGKIWIQLESGSYMLATEDETRFVFEQWWEYGEKERIDNEKLLKSLGHSHIDKYLAAYIAEFTYTKPPASLLETYLDKAF